MHAESNRTGELELGFGGDGMELHTGSVAGSDCNTVTREVTRAKGGALQL